MGSLLAPKRRFGFDGPHDLNWGVGSIEFSLYIAIKTGQEICQSGPWEELHKLALRPLQTYLLLT